MIKSFDVCGITVDDFLSALLPLADNAEDVVGIFLDNIQWRGGSKLARGAPTFLWSPLKLSSWYNSIKAGKM